MKKILTFLVATILGIIVLVLGYAYVRFNSFSPGVVEYEVNESRLSYFQDSYDDCRDAFRAKADMLCEKYYRVEIFSKPVPSEVDANFKMDFCYVPAQKEKTKLLIVSSGVHGVEGYVGSAIQQMLMDEFFEPGMLQDMGILLIHGVNPYGFKYTRRVTENNVDMNRNCDTQRTLFAKENSGYNDLYDMLNPEGEVYTGSLKNRFFMVVAITHLMQESMTSLRQAVLQGQYEHPEGLYFGGNDFEPQLAWLEEVIKNKSADYDTVMNIDLHTGYGQRGVLYLFPNPIDDENVKNRLEVIFKGYRIDWGNSEDFYTVNGSFSDYIGKIIPGKFFMPMLFEYGTLNSLTTLGSVKSIHTMILENQGNRFGYSTHEDSLRVRRHFMEMYNPSSETWRSKVMDDTYRIMEQVLMRY
jgi:hypothetical protein